MFDCNSQNEQGTLPQNDPYLTKFQCGSHSFDKYFYGFISIIFLTPAVLYTWFFFTSEGFSIVPKPKFPQQEMIKYAPVKDLFRILLRMRLLSIVIGVTLMAVLLPLYVASTFLYSTQEKSYIYTLSAAFKAGIKPAGVFLMVWVGLLSALYLGICVFIGKEYRQEQTVNIESNESKQSTISLGIRLFVIFTINIAITLGSNICYVYVMETSSVTGQTAAKISFAVIKFIYNSYLLPLLISSKFIQTISRSSSTDSVKFKGRNSFECFLLIMNTFAIPCLVVALQASTCFAAYNPLIPSPPPINATFTYTEVNYIATSYDLETDAMNFELALPQLLRHYTIFTPMFTYQYQCTSTLLTFYAPVFLLTALLSIMEFALNHFLVQILFHGPQCIIAWMGGILRAFIPQLLLDYEHRDISRGGHPWCECRKQQYVNTIEEGGTFKKVQKFCDTPEKHHSEVSILQADKYYFKTLTDMLVLFSFGIACPLLGLAVCVSIYVRAVMKHRMVVSFLDAYHTYAAATISRTVEDHESCDRFAELAKVLEECIEHSSNNADHESAVEGLTRHKPTPIYKARLLIIVFSSLFLSLFLQDMAGDEIGGIKSLWAPFLMVALPLIIVGTASCVPSSVSKSVLGWLQVRLLGKRSIRRWSTTGSPGTSMSMVMPMHENMMIHTPLQHRTSLTVSVTAQPDRNSDSMRGDHLGRLSVLKGNANPLAHPSTREPNGGGPHSVSTVRFSSGSVGSTGSGLPPPPRPPSRPPLLFGDRQQVHKL